MITNARNVLDPASTSPRIPEQRLAGHPNSLLAPAPHTPAEVAALVAMLQADEVSSITIGHGRHPSSRATAAAVANAWMHVGGTIAGTVDWPQHAASWLKPARQLVRTHPETWVIIDNPAGCAQLVMRLAEHEEWSPARTYGTASLDSPDLAALTGFDVVTGLRGVTAEGAMWRSGRGVRPPARRTG